MNTAVSADGTKIAFDQTGDGPPVILVVGAFNERPTGAPLAKAIESEFTVFNYDRRGRGASGDTLPYAVSNARSMTSRVLIRAAGGAARVFGYSSGAILCSRPRLMGSTSPSWLCMTLRSWWAMSVRGRRKTWRLDSRSSSWLDAAARRSSCFKPGWWGFQRTWLLR